MSSCRSAGQSRASRSVTRSPVSRTSARPCVRSVTITNSPGAESAATPSSRLATAAAVPGGASTSHCPGPEPIRSSPASRAARPNGTPRTLASPPLCGARTCTLASGVLSVTVRAASVEAPLTSQPATTRTGAAGLIGLRAITFSDTHPLPFRVDVGDVLSDLGVEQGAAGHPDPDQGAGIGQAGLYLSEADRAAERRGHPAGGDPAHDGAALDDLAGLGRYHGAVDRLQPDQAHAVALGVLPREFRLADEVVLVQLDRPVQAGAEAAGQPVGVLPDDEVTLLQAQDALGLDPERSDAEVLAPFHQRLPDSETVGGGNVQLVAE